MRKQLAGQMSLYATRRTSSEASFAEQALEDLSDAGRLLPGYFRPDYMQGNVHELVGWAHRRNGREGPARQEFIEAVRAYDRADALLVALDASTPTAACTGGPRGDRCPSDEVPAAVGRQSPTSRSPTTN